MNRFVARSMIIVVLACLLPAVGWAQSEKQGIAIFKQAKELHGKARSRQDLEKAVEKYQEALGIFEKTKSEKLKGWTLTGIGVVYRSWGQYPKALEYLEKSLAITRRIGDVQGEGVTLNYTGLIYDSLGQYAKALEYFEKSLAIRQKLGDVQGEGVTLNNIGMVYNSWGQYAKALEYYEKSVAIRQKLGDVQGEGVTLNNIGMVYKSWGQYAKALEYFEKSVAIRQKLGDVQGEGVTLSNIGLVYKTWSQYAKALEYYEKSLAITRKIGDVNVEGVTLNNIAGVYDSWGQYAKALEYYEKSLAITRKIGNVNVEGVTLNNIAGVYDSWGQYPKALEYYEKSLEITGKIGDVKQRAMTLNNMGMVYKSWGQYPKALEYYEKSLAIKQKLGDVQGEGVTLNNIGMVYKSWGQYAKALEYYEKDLAITRKLGDVRGEGVALNNIGAVYKSWGQYPKALEYYEECLAMKKRIGVPFDLTEDNIGNVYLTIGDMQKAEPLLKKANRYISLGRLALVKSDFTEAKSQFEKELNRSVQNRNVQGLFTGHTGLGLSFEGLNRYDQAAEHYKHAIEVTEQLRQSLTPAQRVDFYDVQIWHIPRITPYKGLSRVLQKAVKPEQSLKESEGTKARSFAESLSRRSENISLDVPKNVIGQDADINNRLAALSKGLQKAYEKGSKDAIESFGKQVKELREERDRHINKLRTEYPLFAATKYPQPMGIEHTALKHNEWVLAYDVSDSGILVYLTRGKQLVKALFKPFQLKELEELVRKFRGPLEIVPGRDSVLEKLEAFDLGSGKKLSDLLLGDILSELPAGSPVIIVPDGSLGVLPFEMLVLKEGEIKTDRKIPYASGTEFFVDRNPVFYYQSITALTLARTLGKKTEAGDRMLVIADPVYQMKDQRAQKTSTTKVASGSDRFYSDLMVAVEESTGGGIRFDRLPLTGDLAQSLKSLFEAKTSLYTGLDASKELFLRKIAPELGQYRSVVFATHGYADTRIPGIVEPILILSTVPQGTDGFLRMSEVMGCRMSADVVALTACQSGLGRIVSGEGTMGMGRAFQYAGAKSVLMSLWSVAESSSVNLVESFFRHVKDGKSKLEALSLAREAIRKAGYDHPFFWAPFILVGEVD